MRTIQLRSAENRVLYEGKYQSFTTCLESAVAKKTNLAGIDLRHRNLSNACLDEAHMPGALFHNSNLTGINLSEANLENADFTGASLYNACLCESEFSECNFDAASFGATDITGAILNGSLFTTLSAFHLDFTGVKEMKTCRFQNPCGAIAPMSAPPIVIHGLMLSPIVFLDRHVKIGNKLRPDKELLGSFLAAYLQRMDYKIAVQV